MCQGVIISLLKFQTKGGKNKKVILKGIGSHSVLIGDYKKHLKKLGWTDTAKNQRVISIESDFSEWNKFTIESGNPSKSELAILKRAYKECAGNASALMTHVKNIGKIDDALVDLLSSGAKKIYEAKRKPLDDDYEAKRKPLYDDYLAKLKPLYNDYLAKRKPLYDDYEAKRKPLYDDYEAKRKPLYDDYLAKLKPLYDDYEAKRKPLDDDYEAKLKPLYDDYEAKLKPLWLKLFSKKENRVERLR